MQKKEYKLPESISPENYDLFIEPNLKSFRFKGEVKISLNIKKPTSKIILNSSELKITEAKVKHNNQTIKPKIKLNEKNETLTLELNRQINNSAIIEIKFQGVLNDKLYGFYRSKYLHKGKEKYLATTQFEAPYARKAFPCFDQPDKKAAFSLTLKIPKNLKAISNMPIESHKNLSSEKIIKFQKTPKMSTYLLYIGVGEFEFIESKLNKTKIRIAATPGKSNEGKFALELTKKFLKYFENFSKVPYPLPKLDLIAIPDFAAGAMENWGAITFRELLLLFNPKKTSLKVKKRIAEVIAHELWHQWSGNLVTMKWWDDLWLNESFATYMAYKAVDYYFPEWEMWNDFIAGETTHGLSDDSLKTTHPIAVKVNTPNEIEEIFDAISYAKGGSVLRMIESYLSPKVFQGGISNYLKKYKYKNAQASDLWNELSKVSNAPIKSIMESWIKQPGYPLIEVKQINNTLTLTQKKFNSKTKDKTLWQIPITIKTNNSLIKTLITKKTQTLALPKNTEWFKINSEQEGFYRVKYQKENLEKLKILISQKKLSAIDRNNIQNDLFALSLFSELPLHICLNFIKSYSNETSSFVLEDIYSNIHEIYFIFSQSQEWGKIWDKYKSHIKEPFQKNFEMLGWKINKNENHNSSLLRPLAINYLSFAEDQEIINSGTSYFKALQKNPDSVHPDIRGAIYTLTARNGNENIYNSLLKIYAKTKSPEEKVKILSALYKFKDTNILKKALDFSLSKKVRIQDLRTVFGNINTNPKIRQIYFKWVKTNWSKLNDYKKVHFVFMSFLESFITLYADKQKEKEIKNFLKNKKTGYEKTKANAFEIMQINTKWFENNKNVLEDYFTLQA